MAAKRKEVGAVPAGLRVLVTAELPQQWDFGKRPLLEGTIAAVQTVEVQGKEGVRLNKVAHVVNKEGVFGLWESATLKPLFHELKVGDNVYCRFEGLGEKKPGRDAPKLFTAGVMEQTRRV